MISQETGRIQAIHHHIDIWKKNDKKLQDPKGFINYLKTCDIGRHRVLDTEKWLKYMKESRKKKITVAEVIFSHRSSLVGKIISMEKDGERPLPHEVYVVDVEEKRILEEISERLKRDDPARRKREQRY